MKKIRTFILLGCMVMAAGSIVAFTHMNTPESDGASKCHLTITYEENGETKLLDTTFACGEISDMHAFIEGLNLPEGSKVECKMKCLSSGDGKGTCSGRSMRQSCSRRVNTGNVQVIKGVDDDGNETMKIMVDGEELDMDGEDAFVLDGSDLSSYHHGTGSTEEDGMRRRVMVIKTEDGDGNVVVKKCVMSGENCTMKCCDKQMPGSCSKRMKFRQHPAGAENIFVEVINVDGEQKKCIVIIQTMDNEDEALLKKEAPESLPNLEKSELGVGNLVFSPNPNDGHFNLSFELEDSTPAHVAVYSMEGRKVYNKQLNQLDGPIREDIDISAYGSGTYFLQITQGDKAQTKKVVIH